VLARLTVTLLDNAPPPDKPVPTKTLVVLATAPVTLATGIVVDAVTTLLVLAYIYPFRVVTVRDVNKPTSPPSIFCQIVPLKAAISPTLHRV
jgi:hypothetical protein